MAKIYVHPNSNNEIKVGEGYAWWVLLFGAFWFWAKGMVARGFFWWFLAIFTLGIIWIFVPIWAYKDYEKHLSEKGYRLKK